MSDIVGPRGEKVDLSTRAIGRAAEHALTDRGWALRAGLEVEFHLYRIESSDDTMNAPAPAHALDLRNTHPGRVYLGETRFDSIEPFLEVLRQNLTELGLPPRSLELELGPSQAEMTFTPTGALELADQAVLLRSAVKQVALRHGLHATFMCRPHFEKAFASGWHLHQSLVDPQGTNLFARSGVDTVLSELGDRYLAGLLAHADEACLLTTPTITGYKRYRSESLAPLRVAWARQHRGALLRVIGGEGSPATRIENRVGDSAANPYLYVASQIRAGLSGIDDDAVPPPATDTPYAAAAGPELPRTLGEAIDVFDTSDLYRSAFGSDFVDYLVGIKRAEWERFLGTVTDWEQQEYLELF